MAVKEATEEVLGDAEHIRLFLVDTGGATEADIKKAMKDQHGIPPVRVGNAIRLMDRSWSWVTAVTRPEDSAKVLTLKKILTVMPIQEAYERSMELAATQSREVYTNFVQITGYFTLTSKCLAGSPVPEEPDLRVFERTTGGRILLSRGYYAAMFKMALAKPGAPSLGNARYHIQWDSQTLPDSEVRFDHRPVPPARPGGRGQGITRVECLLPGTKVPFSAWIPTNVVSVVDFTQVLLIAGRWVGFSPAAAKRGYGDFEVMVTNPRLGSAPLPTQELAGKVAAVEDKNRAWALRTDEYRMELGPGGSNGHDGTGEPKPIEEMAAEPTPVETEVG